MHNLWIWPNRSHFRDGLDSSSWHAGVGASVLDELAREAQDSGCLRPFAHKTAFCLERLK